MPVLEKKYDSKGNEIGVQFNPTASMLNFAVSRAATKNLHKTNEELCRELGLSISIIDGWQDRYGEHFTDWLVEALETYSQPIKESLFAIGYKLAMQGDVNFWKPLATTFGVVKNETIDINVLPQKVKKLEEMTPMELEEYQQRLLASGRGEENTDSDDSKALIPAIDKVEQ